MRIQPGEFNGEAGLLIAAGTLAIVAQVQIEKEFEIVYG